MAFTQYNNAAYKKRQEEYEKKLSKKISKREQREQEKSFLLTPNVIEEYDPKTSGQGNIGQDKKRTGSIFTLELQNIPDQSRASRWKSDRMSPDLKNALFRPIKVPPISPVTIMKKRTRKKHTPISAAYSADGRRRTAKIYRKSSKSAAQGGRRKTRRKRGANFKGRVIFLDFNIEKMKQIGIIPEIYNYADNLNLLHKYRVIDDNGEVLSLNHIDDKEDKGLKLPISAVKNGLVTIQIIPKKSGGRRTIKNKRSKKRRGKKRKTRKRRKKRR